MAAHDQLVTGEPVRPRMKQRHAHHRAHLAVVAQAGSPVKQFLTGMAQRSADHAETRYERRLQGSGGQRHRFKALDGVTLDARVDGLKDAHARLSRGRLLRYSAPTLLLSRTHLELVIDDYTTSKATYREIACLVSGPRSTAVVVAAAPTSLWHQQAATLERAVSSFAS